jgi:hypothetical protein
MKKKLDNRTRLEVLELALENMHNYNGYIGASIKFVLMRRRIVSSEEEMRQGAIFIASKYYPELIDYKPEDVGMHDLYGWFGTARLKENRAKREEVVNSLIARIKSLIDNDHER